MKSRLVSRFEDDCLFGSTITISLAFGLNVVIIIAVEYFIGCGGDYACSEGGACVNGLCACDDIEWFAHLRCHFKGNPQTPIIIASLLLCLSSGCIAVYKRRK